jgi:hypothetical protein
MTALSANNDIHSFTTRSGRLHPARRAILA